MTIDKKYRGIFFMLLAALGFSIMGGAAKSLKGSFGAGQLGMPTLCSLFLSGCISRLDIIVRNTLHHFKRSNYFFSKKKNVFCLTIHNIKRNAQKEIAMSGVGLIMSCSFYSNDHILKLYPFFYTAIL
jgi:hypothetical protein